jgi:hypothetical protein
MDLCVFHPTVAAVERCEICNRALCGLCLWYAEDGRRLCATHAREVESAGTSILPPETYAEAIGNSRAFESIAAGESGQGDGSSRTNNNDLLAMATALVALVTLFSCFGGAYCLPFIAILMGVAAYANADAAVNPQRARLFASIGIGMIAFIFLLFFAFIALSMVFFVLLLLTAA